jgi:hypothetical protein
MASAKTFALAALVGYAAAECPNACSGHGTCGAKDSCSCYQNYQGNDCSERTCYFGIAHVDSPKGDLNADGLVSGPLTTVVTGSEVYPWGTTEQYPNANANEGHFYMECSNKGICDRKSGTCDCFDGYTGTACARAACPNDCSGHGTCESIKELAEMRSFDTNAHHASATRAANSNNGQDYNAAIEESYSYDLWDSDKTMGCKCDPVYYGADCSLKKCKYGVDPLFYDNTDGTIHQTTVVHLGSVSGSADAATDAKAAIGGTFKLVFYDVFGEKYVTSAISAAVATVTPLLVQRALEALPNGVISTQNTDVTSLPGAAAAVAMQGGHSVAATPNAATLLAVTASLTKAGGIGAGTPGATASGLGLGTQTVTASLGDATGPEFTITFNSNPGILRSLEIDTRQILNTGSPDYWVANARQGQFSSRYTTNLGRINTLNYGSAKLYTNSDTSGSVTAHASTAASMVKVGGQEFRVVGANAYYLTLNEPFLGSSVAPTLTNTGAVASAFSAAASPANFYDRLTIGAVTTKQVLHLGANKPLYINGCPFVAALGVDSVANTPIAVSGTSLGILAASAACETSTLYASGSTNIVYRRSDDPNNQNLYKAPADTATALATKLYTRQLCRLPLRRGRDVVAAEVLRAGRRHAHHDGRGHGHARCRRPSLRQRHRPGHARIGDRRHAHHGRRTHRLRGAQEPVPSGLGRERAAPGLRRPAQRQHRRQRRRRWHRTPHRRPALQGQGARHRRWARGRVQGDALRELRRRRHRPALLRLREGGGAGQWHHHLPD